MMKVIMIAAATILGTTVMATAADRPTLLGYSEYAVEAETLEVGVGAEAFIANGVSVTPMLVGLGPTEDFKFDHAEVQVDYQVDQNWTLYGRVETDEDFDYKDTFVGAKLRF